MESEGLVHLAPQLGWQNLENLREENGERLAFQRIWCIHAAFIAIA